MSEYTGTLFPAMPIGPTSMYPSLWKPQDYLLEKSYPFSGQIFERRLPVSKDQVWFSQFLPRLFLAVLWVWFVSTIAKHFYGLTLLRSPLCIQEIIFMNARMGTALKCSFVYLCRLFIIPQFQLFMIFTLQAQRNLSVWKVPLKTNQPAVSLVMVVYCECSIDTGVYTLTDLIEVHPS